MAKKLSEMEEGILLGLKKHKKPLSNEDIIRYFGALDPSTWHSTSGKLSTEEEAWYDTFTASRGNLEHEGYIKREGSNSRHDAEYALTEKGATYVERKFLTKGLKHKIGSVLERLAASVFILFGLILTISQSSSVKIVGAVISTSQKGNVAFILPLVFILIGTVLLLKPFKN